MFLERIQCRSLKMQISYRLARTMIHKIWKSSGAPRVPQPKVNPILRQWISPIYLHLWPNKIQPPRTLQKKSRLHLVIPARCAAKRRSIQIPSKHVRLLLAIRRLNHNLYTHPEHLPTKSRMRPLRGYGATSSHLMKRFGGPLFWENEIVVKALRKRNRKARLGRRLDGKINHRRTNKGRVILPVVT